MAIFGWDGVGVSTLSWDWLDVFGTLYTLAEDGDVSKITLRCWFAGGTKNAACAIYDDALNLVEHSDIVNVGVGEAWVDFPCTVHLDAADYYLMFQPCAGGGDMRSRYTDLGFTSGRYRDAWNILGDWDPTLTNMAAATKRHSIYATYTPSGGGVTVKKGSCVPAMTALLTKFSALKQPREPRFQPQTFPKFTPRSLI